MTEDTLTRVDDPANRHDQGTPLTHNNGTRDDGIPSERRLTTDAVFRLREGYRSREADIELPKPWIGLWCRVNCNPKRKVWRKLFEEETSDLTLCSLILAHNFVDEHGNELPQELSPADLDELPQPMILCISRSLGELVQKESEPSKRGRG